VITNKDNITRAAVVSKKIVEISKVVSRLLTEINRKVVNSVVITTM
jgi:hypothetical protein